MNCREARECRHVYADGELDALRSAELEQHLASCAECARIFENAKELRSALSGSRLYFPAPAGLEKHIRTALQEADGSAAPAPARAPAPGPAHSPFAWFWLRWGPVLAGTAVIAFLLTTLLVNNAPDDRLAQEVLASHVRSLQAAHLMDVASSDQHTVKPWLDLQLDFAAPVVDLADKGFPLTGGRLDYLADRKVAALVFKRQQHIINLFVWPAARDGASAEQTLTLRGYNVLRWTSRGMTFWAISDLNAAELRDFSHLFTARAFPEPAPR